MSSVQQQSAAKPIPREPLSPPSPESPPREELRYRAGAFSRKDNAVDWLNLFPYVEEDSPQFVRSHPGGPKGFLEYVAKDEAIAASSSPYSSFESSRSEEGSEHSSCAQSSKLGRTHLPSELSTRVTAFMAERTQGRKPISPLTRSPILRRPELLKKKEEQLGSHLSFVPPLTPVLASGMSVWIAHHLHRLPLPSLEMQLHRQVGFSSTIYETSSVMFQCFVDHSILFCQLLSLWRCCSW